MQQTDTCRDIGIKAKANRRGQTLKERRQRHRVNIVEMQFVALVGQFDQSIADDCVAFGSGVDGLVVRVIERVAQRDMQRPLGRRLGGHRISLPERQAIVASVGIVIRLDAQFRRASLRVPARELREITTTGFLHRGEEILHRRRATIVVSEITIQAGAEGRLAQQRVQHAHHFRTLLVHGDGVEVVDALVAGRSHRMRQRAGILGELPRLQQAHVLDALQSARMQVGAEFLVAKHGQAFLQRQLEPVAQGHPVARPVVEILVADHRLDVEVIGVSGAVGIGEDVAGIEDV